MQTKRTRLTTYGPALAFAAAFMLSVAVITVSAAPAPSSKGRIPAAAILEDGSIDVHQVPDFVIAWDRSGNHAGYITRDEVLNPPDGPVPVVAEDLTTVVGHMVPDYGFVPAGTDLRAMRRIQVVVGAE